MTEELFDADHYARQVGLNLNGDAAWLHFQSQGDPQGLNPSPYFSTRFYKTRYADWARRGAGTAFQDFLFRVRQGQHRQPHPLIDPDHYGAAYPDLAELRAQAALHFMQYGDGEGRSPSGHFDAAFYRRCYLPLGQAHAFRHYITTGMGAGHLPKPEPRSAAVSLALMQRATSGLSRPFLLVSHDAQAAGVPILTLDLARVLRQRGWDPVFLLGNAGPLLGRFRDLGPVFVLAEGWDEDGLAQGLPKGCPAVVNTAAAARLGTPLATAGLNCQILMHEMADYIRGQGFLPHLQSAQAAGARLVASMPRMAAALSADLGPVPVVQPGIIPPQTPLHAFRRMRAWRQSGPVFIAAGHADHRKGFDLFLAAAGRIAQARPEARFVWLGALDDWAQGLADAALANGLDLTLPGFVSDSLAWYRAADLYLLTSRQDPGPTTVIHAAAVGTPFVGYAADIGLIGLTDGIGKFHAPGDEDGFVATALDMAAQVTPQSRRELRQHIRRIAGFDRYVDAILAGHQDQSSGAA